MRKNTVELEPEVKEYLQLKSKSTRRVYRTAFRRFTSYYQAKHNVDKPFSHFLDVIFANLRKPLREQKMVAESELVGFIDHLKEGGSSDNSVRLYISALQNFMKYKRVTVSTDFIGNLPKQVEDKKNGKHKWTVDQIKQFVDVAKNYRDKATILCMFQSGMAVNEICNLDYGDIQAEFEKGTLPICLSVVRGKTKIKFNTFFGRDAVKYLRLYLATRTDLKAESPLFTKQRSRGGEERLTTGAIQQVFIELAKELPFIKQNGGFNPARPHSLRAAFNSQLIGKIDRDLREFWMGHTIGKTSSAYLNMPTEEMRNLYMTAERYLTIEKTSKDEISQRAKDIKVPPEVEEEITLLKSDVDSLRGELAGSKAELKNLRDYVKENFDRHNRMMDIINTMAETDRAVLQKAVAKVEEKRQAETLRHIAEADKEQPDVGDSQHSSSSKNS